MHSKRDFEPRFTRLEYIVSTLDRCKFHNSGLLYKVLYFSSIFNMKFTFFQLARKKELTSGEEKRSLFVKYFVRTKVMTYISTQDMLKHCLDAERTLTLNISNFSLFETPGGDLKLRHSVAYDKALRLKRIVFRKPLFIYKINQL